MHLQQFVDACETWATYGERLVTRGETLEICLAQRANMQAIFHSVADGLITLDADGRVLNLNRAFEALVGISEDEAAGAPVNEIVRGSLWSVEPMVREVLASGETIRERENVLAVNEGREARVVITCSRLLDAEGLPAGAVLTLRDITALRALESRLEARTSVERLVGSSHAMQEIYALIDQVAPTDSTVLVQGESGTGKELVADAIHQRSRRARGPFVKVNCSALSEGLLESELFGHVKGAFTGALNERTGRFELADGGTILLDEIGDLSETIQVKLLRVLQEREIERVGDTRVRRIDVRVITATHQPLRQRVAEGRFREDLFYRLNVIPIEMPPLRAHLEDVPLLARLFLTEMVDAVGKRMEQISPDAMRVLMDHRWPGNVRELRNAIEHAVVKARGDQILAEDLPREIVAGPSPAMVSQWSATATPQHRDAFMKVARPDDEAERGRILAILNETGWNRGAAAERLGMNRTTLWRKMRRLGITGGG